MTINERFNSIINTLFDGNKSAFAASVGVSPSVVDNIVGKRQGKPSFDVIEKVSALAEVNVIWLITGEGDAFKKKHSKENIKADLTPAATGEGIPLIPVDAMAGFFAGERTVMLHDCEHFVVPSFHNADFLITVRGDSMIPRYNSGDLVACKMLGLSDLFFQWGKVYVIDTDQGALIKKVEQGSSADTIKLVSENLAYSPFELPRACVYHIAIVLGLIRSE